MAEGVNNRSSLWSCFPCFRESEEEKAERQPINQPKVEEKPKPVIQSTESNSGLSKEVSTKNQTPQKPKGSASTQSPGTPGSNDGYSPAKITTQKKKKRYH